MCKRYVFKQTQEELEEWFGAKARYKRSVSPNYNIAPGHEVPVVLTDKASQKRVILHHKWGLIPSWAHGPATGYSLITIPAETIEQQSSFSFYFQSARCLVPASGYYKWQNPESEHKEPLYIYPKNQSIFAFAGLYSHWVPRNGKTVIPSFTIITSQACTSEMSRQTHKPVILPRKHWDQWLRQDCTDLTKLKKLLVSDPVDEFSYHRVSDDVYDVSNNSPKLIAKV